MPDPAPTLTSSQGFTAYSVSNVKKCVTKVTRSTSTSPKLDASTLSIAHGGNRVYVTGMTDNGPSGASGGTVTVTMEGYGAGPSAGSTITAKSKTCKCMDVTHDDNVGELHTWSASYTSDYS